VYTRPVAGADDDPKVGRGRRASRPPTPGVDPDLDARRSTLADSSFERTQPEGGTSEDPFALPDLAVTTAVLTAPDLTIPPLEGPTVATIAEAPRPSDARVRPSASEATRFGKFILGDPVGVGGMAEVRIAFRPMPSGEMERCVVKRIVAVDGMDERELRSLFREESRLARLLDHPNIVRAIETGEIDRVPYIAFELLDAVTFFDLHRAETSVPSAAAIEVGLAVLAALSYAHDLAGEDGRPLQIVHRDVSPENILITREGVVKLADFGIARFHGRDHRTRFGDIKGKLRYMAPEQLEPSEIDRRADLFGLGIVLAESLGAIEAPGRGIVATRMKTQTDLAPDLHRFLLRLTAEAPSNRFATAIEARKELDRVRASLGLAASGALARLAGERVFSALPAIPRESQPLRAPPPVVREGSSNPANDVSTEEIEPSPPSILELIPAWAFWTFIAVWMLGLAVAAWRVFFEL
jgi:eukaryotic-like serine/threonine-protein kinase